MFTVRNHRFLGISLVLFGIIILYLHSSCNTPVAHDTSETPIDSTISVNASSTIEIQDTIAALLKTAPDDTTYEYFFDYAEGSYGVLFFKAGNIFSPQFRSAVAVYTTSDSVVIARIYTYHSGAWQAGKDAVMTITGFSPAYFYNEFKDYNFDGYTDLYLNFYSTMGIAESFGYLLTYNSEKQAFTMHPASATISNIDADPKTKTIISKTTDRQSTKWIIKHYKWVGDSIKLFSEKEIPIKR